ncbi:ATP-binding protein [Streptomyces sp. NPDC007088]|uniref:ATP-binding protein n=1 Tax=Streptomyces sp. NPDC007088 TaxID=3364773 RepID=UPI0036C1770E
MSTVDRARRYAQVEYALPRTPASARWARHMTRDFLDGGPNGAASGAAGSRSRAEDAELVVSELVANAAEHGRSACRLRLRARTGRLVVEVHDDGDLLPVTLPGSTVAERGRGMTLVHALADRVTISPGRGGGKTVLAVLPVGSG